MSTPAVSIIIPTFNRADLLARAVESVAAQTYSDWELIVVDDGSTDETARRVLGFADRWGDRFQFIRQPHVGCCAARNRGIEAARGRFVCFLDSDDEFRPAKLERQLRLFSFCPHLGFVYSDCAYVDSEGRSGESVFDDFAPHARAVSGVEVAPGLYVCEDDLFDHLLRDYFICTIVSMVRREVLGEDIRFTDDPVYAEEWLFHLRIARRCDAGFVDEPLSLHHHTAGSLARTDAARNFEGRRRLLYAMLRELPDLSPRHNAVVRRHLAQTCLQIGHDAYRRGDYSTARKVWAESMRFGAGPRTAWNLAQATAKSWFSGATRLSNVENQAGTAATGA
jgi:glycosyltransferase involved in cell wall biosynthesis